MLNPATAKKKLIGLYITGTVAAASVSFVLLLRGWGAPRFIDAAFFWVLFAAASWHPEEGRIQGAARFAPRTRAPALTAGFLVLIAAALATNPSTAALIGLASPLAPGLWRGPMRATFNAAQVSLYAGLASATFLLARGDIGFGAFSILGAAAAALVAILLNHALVAGIIAIERGRGVLGVWRSMLWSAPPSLAFAIAALFVAFLYREVGQLAAAFLLTPLLVLRQTRRAKSELEDAHERTLRAFVRTVELKDPYTSQHSERVAEIAVKLHRELGTPDRELQDRYYGALLHDIGKVAVSGNALRKPGPLTDEEFENVKRHPLGGAMILSDIKFLSGVVPEVLYHHERLDGRGYPQGLRGDEIPFAARVLAVADVFEALTSVRTYRGAFTQSEAMTHIDRLGGQELDPATVSALADLVAQGPVLPARLPLEDRPVEATAEVSRAQEA